MKLIDIINSYWAILPEKYDAIFALWLEHIRNPKLSNEELKNFDARLDSPVQDMKSYSIENGKAIIPITGPLMKNPTRFEKIYFGFASMYDIMSSVEQAISDKQVFSIILDINSPGGTVEGVEETANFISEASKIKPVIAYTSGMMASAAYWIGSASSEIYISGETAIVGSIGVASQHVDVSALYENMGVKITDIYAGKYKRIASENKPLSDDGKRYLQGIVDNFYTTFVNNVAMNLDVSPARVLADMADGKIFIGSSAVRAGLVDGILPMSDLIALDNSELKTRKQIEVMEGVMITKEQIKAEYPEIYNDIKDQGKAEQKEIYKAEGNDSFANGIKAENDRIKSILAFMAPGREALIKECLLDPKCDAGETAKKIVLANDAAKEKIVADLDSGVKPVEHVADNQPTGKKDFMVMVSEYRAEKKCSASEAMKYVSKNFPDIHQEFLDKNRKEVK